MVEVPTDSILPYEWQRVSQVLGYKIQPLDVHEVRDVSVNKHMLCVSFPLPPEVAFHESFRAKRPKLDLQEK
jgi:hypothetical protein